MYTHTPKALSLSLFLSVFLSLSLSLFISLSLYVYVHIHTRMRIYLYTMYILYINEHVRPCMCDHFLLPVCTCRSTGQRHGVVTPVKCVGCHRSTQCGRGHGRIQYGSISRQSETWGSCGLLILHLVEPSYRQKE